MLNKYAPKIRKIAFERMIAKGKYTRNGDVIRMEGAKILPHEEQTAKKLSEAKDGYYVVFPNEGQIKQIKIIAGDKSKRVSDVILYDKKAYIQYKAELKTLGSPSIETVAKQLSSGSGQSSNVVLDIMGKYQRGI
jgi:hypothetical protein